VITVKKERSWDREHEAAKALVVPVLLFALNGFAAPQVAPLNNGRDQENFRISVDVDLVVLQATVRDRAGHTVMELERGDFTVLEDGKPQPIRLFRHEDTPVTVGLVVDHSSSMREKLSDVTAAAQAFVQSSNSDDRMFVVNFNETVSLGLPMGMPFSDSAEQLGNAIWGQPAVGTTALYDAIIEALKRLQESTHDKKVLIVISDGGDNASKSSLERVLKLTEQSNAMIYTIGIFDPDDPDKNPAVLRRLAKESGGEAFFPAQLLETVEICQRIARDIRDQYTIGYSSTNGKREGVYHKVRVAAREKDNGKLFVRTRAGYSTGGELQPSKDVR
jgi:VWFA-related protein